MYYKVKKYNHEMYSSFIYCIIEYYSERTFLAVGATDLDGSEIVEKLLELRVPQLRSPGRVRGVMEPVKDNMLMIIDR